MTPVELLSLREVARIVGVEPLELVAMRRRGEGPHALRIGRNLRYRREDLDR